MLSNLCSIKWCSIQDQFLGGAKSGCGRSNFCWTSWNLLFMGFPTVYESTRFSWTPILVILGLRTNFYWGRKCVGWVKFYLFLTFWNLLFIGFPTVYDSTTHNYEHPFLVIFALRTRFRLGQEVGGAGQNVFNLKTYPKWWVTTVCNMKICLSSLTKRVKQMDRRIDSWTRLIL